jgi:DNA polymerase-4
MTSATILHADLDAFYASVEQLLHPELRGKAIAVGGGVVLAASYEAKAFGVQGGMSGRRAKQLCPHLQFVGGHFREYQRLGDQVMAVLEDFTPHVQRISIDEAFLDVAGSTHLFGSPRVIAERIRSRVRDEIGLPISVGVAANKHLAKIASQVAKPDGLVVVDPEHELEFLHPLPVGLVWGIGPVTQQKLAEKGIHTIGQLAASPNQSLEHFLGRALGSKVGALANNQDHRKVQPNGRAGSVGAQSALGRRVPTDELLGAVLGHLADRVASRLRAKQRAGRTVTVRVRFAGMKAVTRSHTTAGTRVRHAHAHRDGRGTGAQGAGRSSRRGGHLAAGHLGLQPGRPAGAADGAPRAPRRRSAPRLPHRSRPLGHRPLDGRSPPPLRPRRGGLRRRRAQPPLIRPRRIPRTRRTRAVGPSVEGEPQRRQLARARSFWVRIVSESGTIRTQKPERGPEARTQRATRLAGREWLSDCCSPNGIRTRAATLRGWCPRPLDDGARLH